MSEVLPFDREYTLADLLPPALCARIGPAVAALLPGPAAIVDSRGGLLWGSPDGNAERRPLTFELEPLGYLAGPPGPALDAAATLLEQLIVARARYHMTSHLHVEAVSADYQQLKQKHAALQESEARYRALSEQLERRVAEQVKLIETRQRQLYETERLATIGQLAAGMAHEINNPIGFIRSNLASLGRYLDDCAEWRRRQPAAPAGWAELDLDYAMADAPELIRDCIAGTDRVADIIRNLKEFSNVDSAERRTVDLNDNLRRACALFAGRLPDGVALAADLKPLPALACQPGHLNQVFMNLLANAVRAVADSGTGGEVRVASEALAGGIRISIADTGVGIPPERLARVFEPFYTSRAVGQGTGLGLTVARDIVEAHHGRIEIDSEPGRGTRVTLYLPTQ